MGCIKCIVVIAIAVPTLILLAIALKKVHGETLLPGNYSAYYLVDSHNGTMFQAFCVNKDDYNDVAIPIVCFLSGRDPLDTYYSDTLAMTHITVMENPDFKKTYIWEMKSKKGSEGLLSPGEVLVELSFNVALKLLGNRKFHASGNYRESSSKDSTQINSLYPSFLHQGVLPVSSGLDNSAGIDWTICINTPVYTCRVNENFRMTAKNFLGFQEGSLMAYKTESVNSRAFLNNIKHIDITVNYAVISVDALIKQAESFLNDEMYIYCESLPVRMEESVWMRECVLVNEIKELFRDFSYYNMATYSSIKELIISVMNAFYNVVAIFNDIMSGICSQIYKSKYENKWPIIDRWRTMKKNMANRMNVPFLKMLSREGHKRLDDQIKAYIAAFAVMKHDMEDAQKYAQHKADFEIEKTGLDDLLKEELKVNSRDEGIKSTAAWFERLAVFLLSS